jgi:hypothetical protein
MAQIDLSSANLGRVAGQEVDALMIANTLVWESPSGPDGPYYVNDALAITPNLYSDGTPNIVIGHQLLFHNPGFVTGIRWYDGTSAAGSWTLSLWRSETIDGHIPDLGTTPRLAVKTVAAAGGGYRDTLFDTPITVVTNKVYTVSRYNSIGRYVHHAGFSGAHGAYSDADPVYVPSFNQNMSAVAPGWTGVYPYLFRVGAGDVVPQVQSSGSPYYGITPIFYKSL